MVSDRLNSAASTLVMASWFGRLRRQLTAPVIFLLLAVTLLLMCARGISIERPYSVLRAMVVFDITQSMNVPDVRVGQRMDTRLAASKQVIASLLPQLPCGSDIGIGIFTGHRSFVLFSPVDVCQHYDEILHVVQSIDWRMAWAARSEVAKGIHSGLVVTGEMGRDTRLIFLTDGHEAPPVSAQFPPKYKGTPGDVKGAILGVGGDVALRIPKYDPNGKFIGYWRASEVQQIDSYTAGRPVGGHESMSGVSGADIEAKIAAGQEHLSSLKQPYLQQLVEGLGLEYHRVDSAAGLEAALLAPALAGSKIGEIDVSRYLAGLALLLIVAHFFWPIRRLKQN